MAYTDTVISEIKMINELDIDDKQKCREWMQNLEKAKISAGTFLNNAHTFFEYACLNSNQQNSIKNYYRKGNYEEVKAYINQVQQYLVFAQKYHKEFMEKFKEARSL